jgi:ABC-type multidrug transport system ATPase subunit
MGPSGSGKTSLVSVIGGRKADKMTVSGTILFNGRPLSRQIKRNVGFVLQEDLLFDSLTVHETLLYAARLRLPSDMHMCAACGACERVQ